MLQFTALCTSGFLWVIFFYYNFEIECIEDEGSAPDFSHDVTNWFKTFQMAQHVNVRGKGQWPNADVSGRE